MTDLSLRVNVQVFSYALKRAAFIPIRGCISGLLFFVACNCAHAQKAGPDDSTPQDPPAAVVPAARSSSVNAASPSVDEKWRFFVSETATPLALIAAGLGATLSQMTNSAPLYGRNPWRHYAFPERYGASLGDEVSSNFFSDFLLASAFHEDTRYRREGGPHHILRRVGYAISRAVVTRTDAGDLTFNFANVAGTAMSAALSNAYYPPVSRTASVALVNWGTDIAGAGLSNLLPEFGPGVGHWFKRHLLHHQ